MPAYNRHRFDTPEIIASLRDFAQSRGESVTLHEFCSHLGISQSTLLRRCGRWQNLRAGAGLNRPRAPLRAEFSDSQLIDEYRRIARQLGHTPRESEFNRLSPARYSTLIRRFGDADNLHRRARIRDDCEQTFGPRSLTTLKTEVPWDEAWLRELWPRVRVAFALHSSNLREQFSFCARTASVDQSSEPPPSDACGFAPSAPSPLCTSTPLTTPCDIIFCAIHDWPTAPVPVLVAARVLGDRARQPPVSQP